MNQQERRQFLIQELKDERREYSGLEVPADTLGQKQLLRSLMNVRQAAPLNRRFQQIQDEYLQEEVRQKGVVELSNITEHGANFYLWQGDITRLSVDAIVNAANSGMTGCYQPCHNCIDNCIHTYAGMQLRNYCDSLMTEQGHEEPTGMAKITPAYNLPCRNVIHTVGPIVYDQLTEEHEQLLRSCYKSCLQLALDNGLQSIAFCCISTGVFRFPGQRAAEIAIETVRDFLNENDWDIKVVFNVFKDEDRDIYRRLLWEE